MIVGSRNEISTYDYAAKKVLSSVVEFNRSDFVFELSDDSKMLATLNDGNNGFTIWDPKDYQKIIQIQDFQEEIKLFRFSPAGKYFVLFFKTQDAQLWNAD